MSAVEEYRKERESLNRRWSNPNASDIVYGAHRFAEDYADAAIAEALKDTHCRDCCCAQSWLALGVYKYDGKSIPEHITALRSELAALQAEIDHLKLRVCVSCQEYGLCAIYRAAPQPRHAFACNRWQARKDGES
jgi:hypothetical protein